MRLLSVLPLGVVACLPLLTSAGFLDRLRGGGSPSSVDAPAAPSPPSEPSLDAFGGSAAGHAAAAAVVGQPTLSGGQPAVKTANAVPVQQPVQPVEPFDGIEWRTKYYVIRPSELKGEAFTLLAITALVTLALLGKARNKAQALSWWKANISVLGGQFSSFTSKPASASLTRGDPSTFLAYASGRRNVSLCTVKIRTLRWHDLPSMLFECGYRLYDLSRIGEDGSVALEFDLPAASNGGGEFVWALVRRHAMQELREARFDLQAFTSIVEPPKDLLPNEEFVVFSEQGVLNEIFLGSKRADRVGFRELLDPKNAQAKKALKWLRAIIIGDVVSDRPDEATLEKEGAIPKSRKLTLLITLPPKEAADETRPLLELACNLLDVLAGGSGGAVPNEVSNRGKKRRAEVHSLLLSESRKEAKEKSLQAQAAIKKKAEQDKLDRMSTAERRKYENKVRDKEMRKMAVKQQKK